MTYKTSGIGLNIPPKVLSVSVTNVTGTSYWPHNDGAGDRWWQSGSSPKFYKWTVTMTVTATAHGSHLTRDDFQYNGLDVTVGDWLLQELLQKQKKMGQVHTVFLECQATWHP